MTVRYQVRNASWTPHYDARLATGSKTTPPLLELTRRADIVQRTGESWDNVALQLSTTRPTANASAPVIDTVTVDFEPEAKDLAASASAPPPAPMAAYDGLEMRKKSAVGRGLGAAGGAACGERARSRCRRAGGRDCRRALPGRVRRAGPPHRSADRRSKTRLLAGGRHRAGAHRAHRAEARGQSLPLRQADTAEGFADACRTGIAIPRRHLRRHRRAARAIARRGPRARLRRRRPGSRAPCDRR